MQRALRTLGKRDKLRDRDGVGAGVVAVASIAYPEMQQSGTCEAGIEDERVFMGLVVSRQRADKRCWTLAASVSAASAWWAEKKMNAKSGALPIAIGGTVCDPTVQGSCPPQTGGATALNVPAAVKERETSRGSVAVGTYPVADGGHRDRLHVAAGDAVLLHRGDGQAGLVLPSVALERSPERRRRVGRSVRFGSAYRRRCDGGNGACCDRAGQLMLQIWAPDGAPEVVCPECGCRFQRRRARAGLALRAGQAARQEPALA